MRQFRYAALICLPLLVLRADAAVAQAPVQGYAVINSYPHDTSAYTEGLVLYGDHLYESTGLNGASTLRDVDVTTGTVRTQVDLSSEYFGEGMTIFQGKIFQLTWQSQVGFIYDPATFARIGQFAYSGEGWGLTHDDQYLIMSDGTNRIRFLDPVTFDVVRSVDVFNDGTPLTNINELEYINGEIYANIWLTDWVVRIDPWTGAILGWIDFRGLLPAGMSGEVFNGIAYEPQSGHLLVTGKFWPLLFEVAVVSTSNQAPVANDQSLTTAEDVARDVTLTGSDADGDPLSYTILTMPAHGTLSGAAPQLTYHPTANYSGADSFTFSVNDGQASSAAATIALDVTPVNDAPVADGDAYTVDANTTLSVQAPGVLANDSDVDGDALSAALESGPSHGSLSLQATGGFSYTPVPGYTGPDSFTYRAGDGAAGSGIAAVSLTVVGSLPALSVSPTSLGFGNQAVNTTSAPRVVTLTNTGGAPLSIVSITISGANAGDFAQLNSCASPVAPGASCAISVTFRPAAVGQRKASLSIVHNAGSPRVVALSGSGKKR
jgi:glutaminyl-peptide cyclotransferase